MAHILFKPRAKVKVASSKPQLEPESPQITVRIKKRKPRKKKGKRCLDCIDAEIMREDDGFKLKAFVFCHFWNTVVRVSMARWCPHFCPKAKRREGRNEHEVFHPGEIRDREKSQPV